MSGKDPFQGLSNQKVCIRSFRRHACHCMHPLLQHLSTMAQVITMVLVKQKRPPLPASIGCVGYLLCVLVAERTRGSVSAEERHANNSFTHVCLCRPIRDLISALWHQDARRRPNFQTVGSSSYTMCRHNLSGCSQVLNTFRAIFKIADPKIRAAVAATVWRRHVCRFVRALVMGTVQACSAWSLLGHEFGDLRRTLAPGLRPTTGNCKSTPILNRLVSVLCQR